MIKKEKREEINKTISFLIRNITRDTFLYINYPFCSNLCRFCIYKIYQYNKKNSEIFLKYYKKEIFLYEKALEDSGFKFRNIHIGGGTPNLVPLKSLVDPLKNLVDLAKVDHFIVEIFPVKIFDKYLDKLKEIRNVKVQLGVQTLNKGILKNENRFTSRINMLDCFQKLSRSGLIWSVDLVYGFKDENKFKRDYLSEIKTILNYKPSGFHLYGMRSEKSNRHYQQNSKCLDSKATKGKTRFKIDISELTDTLVSYGYKKIGDEWCFGDNIDYAQKTICYDGQAKMIKPAILGVGLDARSYHRSMYYKNTRTLSEYINLLDQVCFPVSDFTNLKKGDLYPIVCFLKRFRISSRFNFKEFSSSVSLSKKERERILDFINYLKRNGFKHSFNNHEFKVIKSIDYTRCLYWGEKYFQIHR